MEIQMDIYILLIQTFILICQLYLSNKINNQTLAQHKGYFLINDTNFIYGNDELLKKELFNRFNLKSDIVFHLVGDSDVILVSTQIEVNGSIYKNENQYEHMTYYTLDSRCNQMGINLQLKENDLNKGKIQVKVKLRLRNPNGYKYTENIIMDFENKTKRTTWLLSKYNMEMVG